MAQHAPGPVHIIRPNGQVERLDLPEPAATPPSYGRAMRLRLRGGEAPGRERRARLRPLEAALRGRLLDLVG